MSNSRIDVSYNRDLRPLEDLLRRVERPGDFFVEPGGFRTPVCGVLRRLREAFAPQQEPAKLAWLLEHHYSPEGLAFGALKGADVARAALLRNAAERAGCVLHLALVHIEETGPAEPNYREYSR